MSGGPKTYTNGDSPVASRTNVYEVEWKNGDEEGWRSPSVAYDIVCVACVAETLILSQIQ